ncbi:BON domain-containing protein [Desulfovibrio aminophilus]|nr:BON domain-containing protein [Desulfovibrio aminophilus]MCM0755959.1 BON domain-containing protein [Desulfovibrio aminophilus]
MKRLLLLLIFAMLLFSAAGCTTAYKAAVDERSIGTQTDDEIITAEIKADFLQDELIKYMDFDAAVYDGHAYILGEYESREQIARSVQIARAVDGVRGVTTYMLPKKDDELCGTSDNLLIYAKVKKELIADGDIKSTNVNTKVVQCNVVLLGIVGSQAEAGRAVNHAKGVDGVRSVKSFLRVAR